MGHDLPLTRGLQLVLLEVTDLSREFELPPLLVFRADAGIHAPIDEVLHSEIPPLMATLLIVVCRAEIAALRCARSSGMRSCVTQTDAASWTSSRAEKAGTRAGRVVSARCHGCRQQHHY